MVRHLGKTSVAACAAAGANQLSGPARDAQSSAEIL
jgi:hypothetical protein